MQHHTLLPLLLGSLLAAPGLLSADVDLLRQWAVVDFPLAITFYVEAGASQEITQAVLRFRLEERSCAQVESIGYGEVASGPQTSAQWTWDMRRTGGLPPGAVIHFSWKITDASGAVTESAPTTVEIVPLRWPAAGRRGGCLNRPVRVPVSMHVVRRQHEHRAVVLREQSFEPGGRNRADDGGKRDDVRGL